MVASPALNPVTNPFSSTIATVSSLDLQVTSLFTAFVGVIVASSCAASNAINTSASSFTATPVTDTSSNTTSLMSSMYSTYPVPSSFVPPQLTANFKKSSSFKLYTLLVNINES